jgi:hypothetical protein
MVGGFALIVVGAGVVLEFEVPMPPVLPLGAPLI